MKLFARSWLVALAVALAPLCAGAESSQREAVTVYKSPTCGCCNAWIHHLEANGFRVTAHDVADLGPVKAAQRVPAPLASCHTALVAGYVIEGHVPAAEVARLLEERPAVRGLAVPGMPVGSPGMEGPNPEAYRVLSFDAAGRIGVFASHAP